MICWIYTVSPPSPIVTLGSRRTQLHARRVLVRIRPSALLDGRRESVPRELVSRERLPRCRPRGLTGTAAASEGGRIGRHRCRKHLAASSFVSADVQQSMLRPVVSGLAAAGVPVSMETYHPEVTRGVEQWGTGHQPDRSRRQQRDLPGHRRTRCRRHHLLCCRRKRTPDGESSGPDLDP